MTATAPTLERIEAATAELRQQLREHPVYDKLRTLEDLRIFSEHHVFAVWDFMSLLKSLQQRLTCVTLPWRPAKNPTLARFINEIVWGEESDVNERGEPTSHFEMYRAAMQEVGADAGAMDVFLAALDGLDDVDRAARSAAVPQHVRAFLNFTFGLIGEGEAHKIAATFTFGREDLIPDLFISILRSTKEERIARLTPNFSTTSSATSKSTATNTAPSPCSWSGNFAATTSENGPRPRPSPKPASGPGSNSGTESRRHWTRPATGSRKPADGGR